LSQLNCDGNNGSPRVKLATAITTASDDKNAHEKKKRDSATFKYKVEKSFSFILLG